MDRSRPSAQREDILRCYTPRFPMWVTKLAAALRKGATPRLLARFPGSVADLLALCPVLLLVGMRRGDFSACEGFGEFLRVGRLHRPAKTLRFHRRSLKPCGLLCSPMAKVELHATR